MISIKGIDGLTVRDLAALAELGEIRHFGKVARSCGIAQPSLSAIVRKAEDGLGLRLFERSPRHVEVTPEGRRILTTISEALAVLKEVHPETNASSEWTGTFRLGIIPTLGPYLLPLVLPSLRKRFPHVAWELVEAQTARLVRLTHEGRLDAVLASIPLEDNGLSEIALHQEELVLALPPDHRLADRKAVGIDEIEPKEMILLERGHCLREDVLKQCHAQITAKPTHAASLEVQRLMVKAGAGCAVFPRLAIDWDRHADGQIRYVPFESPAPSRTIGLAFRKGHPRKPAIQAIAARIREDLRGG